MMGTQKCKAQDIAATLLYSALIIKVILIYKACIVSDMRLYKLWTVMDPDPTV